MKYKSLKDYNHDFLVDNLHLTRGYRGNVKGMFVTNKHERKYNNPNRVQLFFLSNSEFTGYNNTRPQNRNYLTRYGFTSSMLIHTIDTGDTIERLIRFLPRHGSGAYRVLQAFHRDFPHYLQVT